MIKVNIFESEKGWGQKLLETKEFKTEVKAKEYIIEFNSKNNLSRTPDYYTYAVLDVSVENDTKGENDDE